MINTNLNSSRYTTHLMIILVRWDSSEPSITLDSFFFKRREGTGRTSNRLDAGIDLREFNGLSTSRRLLSPLCRDPLARCDVPGSRAFSRALVLLLPFRGARRGRLEVLASKPT